MDLATLTTLVAVNRKTTAEQWTGSIRPQWAKVKASLDQLNIPSKQLQDQIASETLENLLLGIMEAKTATGAAIDAIVSSPQPPSDTNSLLSELETLSKSLSTLNVAARVQVNSLGEQINQLTQWAQNAEGAPSGRVPESLGQDVAEARRILGAAKAPR
jgi:hypothetical protein